MSANNKSCNTETITHTCYQNNYLIVLVVFILLAIILSSHFIF